MNSVKHQTNQNWATGGTFCVERKLYLLAWVRTFTFSTIRDGSDCFRLVVGSDSWSRGEGKREQQHSPSYHSLPSTLKFLRSLAMRQNLLSWPREGKGRFLLYLTKSSMNPLTSLRQLSSLASLCSPLMQASFFLLCVQRSNRAIECSLLTVTSSGEVSSNVGTVNFPITSPSSNSSTLNAPFSSSEPLIRQQPIFIIKPGSYECLFPISTASSSKDLKQESSTTPNTSFRQSLHLQFCTSSQYFKAEAAPIDLPQRTTFCTLNFSVRWSTTASTSFFSLAPKEIELPSELPHPAKSKLQKERPILSTYSAQRVPTWRIWYFPAASRSYCAGRARRSLRQDCEKGCRSWRASCVP